MPQATVQTGAPPKREGATSVGSGRALVSLWPSIPACVHNMHVCACVRVCVCVCVCVCVYMHL